MSDTTDDTTTTTTDDTASTDTTTTDTTTSTDTDSTDWKAEAEKWKAQSRKHEQRAKDNSTAAAELEKLRTAQMTEQERAVAEAFAKGKSEGTSASSKRLAAAEIKAALAGIVDNPQDVVDDLDLAKYVTDTGDVDEESVGKLRDKYAAIFKRNPADFGGGSRGGDVRPPNQLTQADLAKMSPAEINKARREGRLNTLLGK